MALRFTSWTRPSEATEPAPAIRLALPLAVLTLALTFFGLTMLYSTSSGQGSGVGEQQFLKQSLWAVLGMGAAGMVFFYGHRRCLRLTWPVLGFSALLLVIALFGPARKGAHRWIALGHGLNFQPSELAKLAVVICLARYAAVRAQPGRSFSDGLLPALGAVAVVIGLVGAGRDLGATCLLAMTTLGVLVAAGMPLRYVLILPVMAPVGLLAIKWLSPVRWDRIISFLDPERYQQDIAYQLWNSLLALGSGNWFGLGFTESRMKALYLPEAHTDFIVSIVGEELGLVGILGLITGYLLLGLLGVLISLRARERSGMLLGFGLTLLLVMQALINLGVVSGAFPTKGMPAPFMSYGGSNLLMCYTAIGLLLSIAMEAGAPEEEPSGGSRTRWGEARGE